MKINTNSQKIVSINLPRAVHIVNDPVRTFNKWDYKPFINDTSLPTKEEREFFDEEYKRIKNFTPEERIKDLEDDLTKRKVLVHLKSNVLDKKFKDISTIPDDFILNSSFQKQLNSNMIEQHLQAAWGIARHNFLYPILGENIVDFNFTMQRITDKYSKNQILLDKEQAFKKLFDNAIDNFKENKYTNGFAAASLCNRYTAKLKENAQNKEPDMIINTSSPVTERRNELLSNIVNKKIEKTERLDKQEVFYTIQENAISEFQEGKYTNELAAAAICKNYTARLNKQADTPIKQEKVNLFKQLNELTNEANYLTNQISKSEEELSTNESDFNIHKRVDELKGQYYNIQSRIHEINEELDITSIPLPTLENLNIAKAKEQRRQINAQIADLKSQKDPLEIQKELDQIIKSSAVPPKQIAKQETAPKMTTPVEYIQTYLQEVKQLRNPDYKSEQFPDKQSRIDTLLKACVNVAKKNNINLTQFTEFEESKLNISA